jgi:membrane protease YdiL (CAAX protease family)
MIAILAGVKWYLIVGFVFGFGFSFLVFLQYWGLNSGPTPSATPTALFHGGFFKTRSHELFARGWLQTATFLISAS